MIVEKQKFKNKVIWIVVLMLNCFVLYGVIKQLIYKIPFGENPAPNFILLLGLVTTLLLLGMLFLIYLKITINENEIIIHFYPFIKKTIQIKEIKNLEIVEYNPLRDYGGWGIRYGKKGKAYTIGGKLGLSITLLNNKNILVGILNKNNYKSLKIRNYENN